MLQSFLKNKLTVIPTNVLTKSGCSVVATICLLWVLYGAGHEEVGLVVAEFMYGILQILSTICSCNLHSYNLGCNKEKNLGHNFKKRSNKATMFWSLVLQYQNRKDVV